MQSKTPDEDSPNILLLDSSTSKKQFKIINNTFKKIITFDINSDRILSEKNFSHIVSDDFLNNSESNELDSICIDLCQWYNKNDGNELLSYEKINLGSLFRVEFHNFLIPVIKNFFILDKLKNLYPNSTFTCSGNLFQIATKLGMNSIPIDGKSSDIELTWDKIQYNIIDSISLKISKDNLNKLKNLSNVITNLIIKTKTNTNHKKQFALIEFDSKKYKKIFNESNNLDDTIYLYNRHRPIFYNTESLNIIRNSNVIPYIIPKHSLKQLKSNIDLAYQKLLSNLEKFFTNEIFFSNFFKFHNIELWTYIKPNLIKIFEKKLLDSIHEIEYAKSFLTNNRIDSVLLLSESGFTEQIIINLAKKLSINIILLQHGLIIDNPNADNYNKILTGVQPLDSNYFFTWGNISPKNTKKLESKTETRLIGSPSLDKLHTQDHRKPKKPNNILLLATGPRNHQSVGHDVNMWKKYESMIKSIYDSVLKHNMTLIIKKHPDMAETDFSPELYSYLSSAQIVKNDELSNLLIDAKIVLSLGISSGILEAQMLEKPVISILVDYDVFGSTEYISNSCLETTLEEFDHTFSKLLNEPDSLDILVQKGSKKLNQNISNIGFSSQILFDTMKKLQ